ncbi:hypothetical protein J3F84DRAFT_379525 [Trichoderma pleuroticola]
MLDRRCDSVLGLVIRLKARRVVVPLCTFSCILRNNFPPEHTMLLTPMGASVKPRAHSRSRLSGRLRLASDIEAWVANQAKPNPNHQSFCRPLAVSYQAIATACACACHPHDECYFVPSADD